MGELTARFDLPLGAQAPKAARDAISALLASWGFYEPDWLGLARVVVSELVSNAVVHGGGCLSVEVQAHGQQVTIGAADGSPVAPRRREADPAGGGRGMALIEALTTRWGVYDHDGGKYVWAVLPPHPETHSSNGGLAGADGTHQRTRPVAPTAGPAGPGWKRRRGGSMPNLSRPVRH
jgi:anti-sigma regulatory factor (Ser/Thr protein kinase)